MKMQDLAEALILSLLPRDGERQTLLDGVTLFRTSEPIDRLPRTFPAAVCILLQGVKRAYFDGGVHIYDASRYLCSSVPLPVEGEVIEASRERPLLGMMVSFETPTMAEVCAAYEAAYPSTSSTDAGTQNFMSVAWDPAFRSAVEGLLEALAEPSLLQLVGPGRLREVLIAILRGPAGPMILTRSRQHRPLVGVIDYIRKHLDTPLRVESIARQAGMSKAVFHRYFKQATSQTPIQFIKALRLNEGARLLSQGASVGEAATRVGYLSPSQFSRDFQRQFRRSPSQWRSAANVAELRSP
ncbi:MAG: AraC family transcriptional regulator [Acidobacteriota bacterium]